MVLFLGEVTLSEACLNFIIIPFLRPLNHNFAVKWGTHLGYFIVA